MLGGGGGGLAAAIGKGGLAAELPATNGFLRFSRKKHSFQHTFLSKEDIPVSCSECSHYYSVRQYKNVSVVHV